MGSRKPHGNLSALLMKRIARSLLLPLLAVGISFPSIAPVQAGPLDPIVSSFTSSFSTNSSGVVGGLLAGGETITIAGSKLTGITGVTVGGVAATGVTGISDTSARFYAPTGASNITYDVVVTTNDGAVTKVGAYTYLSTIACGGGGNFYIGANQVTNSKNCTGSVIVPEGITSIAGGAFCNRSGSCVPTGSNVGAVTLPSTLVTINSISFMQGGVTSLSITKPSSLTSIGSQAFTYSTLPSIEIPKSVTRLIGATFYKANSLTSVTFEEPSSLTSIGTEEGPNGLGPFYHTRIFSMSLPSSITTIGAFFKDTPLETLTVNSNITSIAAGALPRTSPPYASTTDYVSAPSGLRVVINTTNSAYVNSYAFTAPAPLVVTSAASVPARSSITSLSVATGFTQGGTSVRLRGTNLGGVNNVWVRGILATSVVVESSTSLTFITPAAAAGTTDIWLNGSSGPAIGSGLFTYVSSAITSVTPNSGLTTGGTSVTISGQNFTGATGVNFGATAAANFTVVDSSTITATSPAVALGSVVDIRVVHTAGTSAIVTAGRFTYISTNPKLSALTLNNGATLSPSFSGTTTSYTASVTSSITSVNVTATSAAGATIKINGTTTASGIARTISGLTTGDNTILIVTTAQDAVTMETYTVVVNKASSNSNDARLSGLSLSSGTLSPTFDSATVLYTASVTNAVTSITVTPTVNQANASVTVNGTSVVSANASGSINLSVGSNTVTVLNTAQDGTTTKSYTITVTRAPPAPTITAIDNSSPNYGATVRITGTDFTGATSVQIGSSAVATYTVESSTSLTFVVNSSCCTAAAISVTTSGGTGTSGTNISPQPQLPIITSQPQAVSKNVGQSATFSVVATAPADSGVHTYQWFKGSTAISGATSASYTFTTASLSDAGDYSAVVYNTISSTTVSTTSSTAALSLTVVNRYTVTYNGNLGDGGSVPSDAATYLSGDTVNVLGSGTLTRTGYTFNGWTTDSANTNSLLTNSSTVSVNTANVILYAAWTANQYVVTYDANGGTSDTATATFASGTTPLRLPTATRANFTFNGWFTTTTNGTLVGLAGANYSPIESSTVHAQWTQNSLAGLPAGSLTFINSYQVSQLITVTSTFSTAGNTVTLVVPAGALTSGTTVTYWLLSDAAQQAAPLPGQNEFVLSMVVSWLNSDGTVPDTAVGKPLVMTIANSAIKSGASVYSVVGSSVTLLGVATQDGQVSVNLTSDPQIYVVQPRVTAPSVTATSSSVNDSFQSVKITPKPFEIGPASGGNTLKIAGTFVIAGVCRIIDIVVADETLPLSSWSVTTTELSIVMPANKVGLTTIQVKNNCLPAITPIDYFYLETNPVPVIPAPVEIPVATPPLVITKVPGLTLKRSAVYYFASGRSLLNKAQRAEITKLAKDINLSQAKTVYIYGFADATPGANNVALSKKRANSAQQLLAKLIVDKTIRVGWYGSKKPLSTGKSAKDNAKNRRVEIWSK